jgi:hypothetical protein
MANYLEPKSFSIRNIFWREFWDIGALIHFHYRFYSHVLLCVKFIKSGVNRCKCKLLVVSTKSAIVIIDCSAFLSQALERLMDKYGYATCHHNATMISI